MIYFLVLKLVNLIRLFNEQNQVVINPDENAPEEPLEPPVDADNVPPPEPDVADNPLRDFVFQQQHNEDDDVIRQGRGLRRQAPVQRRRNLPGVQDVRRSQRQASRKCKEFIKEIAARLEFDSDDDSGDQRMLQVDGNYTLDCGEMVEISLTE